MAARCQSDSKGSPSVSMRLTLGSLTLDSVPVLLDLVTVLMMHLQTSLTLGNPCSITISFCATQIYAAAGPASATKPQILVAAPFASPSRRDGQVSSSSHLRSRAHS